MNGKEWHVRHTMCPVWRVHVANRNGRRRSSWWRVHETCCGYVQECLECAWCTPQNHVFYCVYYSVALNWARVVDAKKIFIFLLSFFFLFRPSLLTIDEWRNIREIVFLHLKEIKGLRLLNKPSYSRFCQKKVDYSYQNVTWSSGKKCSHGIMTCSTSAVINTRNPLVPELKEML